MGLFPLLFRAQNLRFLIIYSFWTSVFQIYGNWSFCSWFFCCCCCGFLLGLLLYSSSALLLLFLIYCCGGF
jgi:hypothetical protein